MKLLSKSITLTTCIRT